MLDTKSEIQPTFEGLSNCGALNMWINWRSYSRPCYCAYKIMVVFLHVLFTEWLSTEAVLSTLLCGV